MKIRIKAGEVEIEYSEPTEEKQTPTCCSPYTGHSRNTKPIQQMFIETVSAMCNEVKKLREGMYD